MKLKPTLAALTLSLSFAVLLPAQAMAFCGVIEEKVSASTMEKATRRAERNIRKQVKALKRQHGKKLQLSDSFRACVSGGISVDDSGKETVGNPACTVTQPFCVNP